MGDFGDAERRILAFMAEGTEFVFQEKNYKIILSGKPTCHKGEPKTDIYILAESSSDKVEIKISYKKAKVPITNVTSECMRNGLFVNIVW